MSSQPKLAEVYPFPSEDDYRRCVGVIKKVELFDPLKYEIQAMESLASLMTRVDFRSGEYAIREGEVGADLYILLSGRVSVYMHTIEGERYRVGEIQEGEHPFFGEGGLIVAGPHSASILCESDVRCLVLSREMLQDFAGKHPCWAMKIYEKIAEIFLNRYRKANSDLLLLHTALMDEIRN